MGEPLRELPPGVSTERPRATELVQCGTCEQEVDALRAPALGVYGSQFHYFCSARCKASFVPPEPQLDDSLFGLRKDSSEDGRAPARREASSAPPSSPGLTFEASPLASRVSGGASGACVLAAFAAWAVDSGSPWPLAGITAACACAALSSATFDEERARIAALLSGLALALAGQWADWLGSSALHFEGLLACSLCALVVGARPLYMPRYLSTVADPLAEIEQATDTHFGTKGQGPDEAPVELARLRAGEEVHLRAGEVSAADMTVTWGRGHVVPWPGARRAQDIGVGDGLVAGARVSNGELRGLVRWHGNDRAGARLLRHPSQRADREVTAARRMRSLYRYAPAVMGLGGGGLGFLQHHTVSDVLTASGCSILALVSLPLLEIVTRRARWTVVQLLERGVFLRRASHLQALSDTESVVLSAEGALTEGRPVIAALRSFSERSKADVLALAAGAHRNRNDPLGRALGNAVHAQGLKPHPVRSQDFSAGKGVIALDTAGHQLIVGNRALLLAQLVSCASAEAALEEWEAAGQQALLVAHGGRLVGAIALHDGVSRASRGAVQQLLDAQLEVILLSTEGQLASDALGRAVGISHVRAEVLPSLQGKVVRRLSQSRRPLVVVGRGSTDAAALSAADVGISLDVEGAPLDRWPVEVRSSRLADAAAAICAAKSFRGGSQAILLSVVGGLSGSWLALLVGAPSLAPLLVVAGAAAWGLSQATSKHGW